MERILVVDDEVEVCNVLEEFLTEKGFNVYTALDGPTALHKVKEVRPHVVLLDIIMPGMGGMDVLKEIKQINPTIGVIMTTAVRDHELAKKTLELGAYDYITKPVDFNYLEDVLMVMIVALLE